MNLKNIDKIDLNSIYLYTFKNKMNNQDNFIPGKFDYIENYSTRDMLVNGYQAINILEIWDYMKKDCSSYMTMNFENSIICTKMCELGISHSGTSFGWTMRTLQYIAKNGEQKFKKEYLSKKQKNTEVDLNLITIEI